MAPAEADVTLAATGEWYWKPGQQLKRCVFNLVMGCGVLNQASDECVVHCCDDGVLCCAMMLMTDVYYD